jgi:hypothetical protein
MLDDDPALDAAQAVRDSWQAIRGAAERRAAAVQNAEHLIEVARASERAEQDAARSALAASLCKLLSVGLTMQEIIDLCQIDPREEPSAPVVEPAGRLFLPSQWDRLGEWSHGAVFEDTTGHRDGISQRHTRVPPRRYRPDRRRRTETRSSPTRNQDSWVHR